jgi:hypothetical protein
MINLEKNVFTRKLTTFTIIGDPVFCKQTVLQAALIVRGFNERGQSFYPGLDPCWFYVCIHGA